MERNETRGRTRSPWENYHMQFTNLGKANDTALRLYRCGICVAMMRSPGWRSAGFVYLVYTPETSGVDSATGLR